MTTIQIVQTEAARVHDPTLAEVDGMVYQVWEDGEITLQKSGRLLWDRTLHVIYPGLSRVPPLFLPSQLYSRSGVPHSYAFVNEENAKLIRSLIQSLIPKD